MNQVIDTIRSADAHDRPPAPVPLGGTGERRRPPARPRRGSGEHLRPRDGTGERRGPFTRLHRGPRALFRPGPAGGRLRRGLLAALAAAALAAAALAVPVTGAARPEAVSAPVPPRLAPLRAATAASLAERYAATRGAIETAMRTATAAGHRWRAAMLRAMADPARHFLSFDGRDGGRTAEVFGDLATADRIAVIVPGSGTGLDTYGLLRGGSMRLQRALGGRGAVVAWLGYRPPSVVSLQALTPGRADEAVPALRAFVRELARLRPAARVGLLCHSYGSVLCGRAAPGLEVADIILCGSPGAGVDDVAAMRTRAAVWAARGTGDRVADLPHAAVRLPFGTIGLGEDPLAPRFGARIFAAGDGGHSGYLVDGSPALANIARILSGHAPTGVSHAS